MYKSLVLIPVEKHRYKNYALTKSRYIKINNNSQSAKSIDWLVALAIIALALVIIIIIIIIIIKLSFITRLNKTNLARRRVTEIYKTNENKSQTRQPHRRAPSNIEISKNNENKSNRPTDGKQFQQRSFRSHFS